MGALEIVIGVVLALFGALAGLGATVASSDFRIARRLFWLAWICLGAIGPMWNVTANREEWLRLLVVGVLGALAAIGLALCLRWVANKELHAEGKTSNPIRSQESQRGGLVAEAHGIVTPPSPLNDTIQIECGIAALPPKVPPSGTYWILQTWPIPAENGGGGLMQMFGTADAEITWPMYSPIDTAKCIITNFGTAPVFRLQLGLRLTFLEAKRQPDNPNSAQSGETKLDRMWPIEISRIEPGADKAFVFWIANNSPDFVRVDMPENLSLIPLGKQTREFVRLIKGTQSYVFINPLNERRASQKKGP